MFFIILISLFNIISSFATEPRLLDLSGTDVVCQFEQGVYDQNTSLNKGNDKKISIANKNGIYLYKQDLEPFPQFPSCLHYIAYNDQHEEEVYNYTVGQQLPEGGSVIVAYKTCFLEIAKLLQNTTLEDWIKKILVRTFKEVSPAQSCIMSRCELWGLEAGGKDIEEIKNKIITDFSPQKQLHQPSLTKNDACAVAYAFGVVTLNLLSDYVTEISTIDAYFTIQEKDSVERKALGTFFNQFCQSTEWFLNVEKKRLNALICSKKKTIFCTLLVTLLFAWDLYNNHQNRTSAISLCVLLGYGLFCCSVFEYLGLIGLLRLFLAQQKLDDLYNLLYENEKDFRILFDKFAD